MVFAVAEMPEFIGALLYTLNSYMAHKKLGW
jgi:hypothetical protein